MAESKVIRFLRLILSYTLIMKKVSKFYTQELIYFLRAKGPYLYGPYPKDNPSLFLRKCSHHLERYLLSPDSYTPLFAESVLERMEKVLSEIHDMPKTQENWATKIINEYKAGKKRGQLGILCPMLNENAIRKKSPVNTLDLMKLLKQRRSRRIFVNTPLTDSEKKMICEAAQYAPSSCNRQTIYLIFVEDRDLKEFIASTVPGGHQFFSKAPCILILISDAGDYRYPEERTIPYIDGAAAIQNIYLLCETMHLGCCCGSYSSFGSIENEREVRKRLKIPETYLIVGSLAIGKSEQFVCEIPRDLPENRFWTDFYGK